MAKRRKFIVGLGALASGSAAAMGTGAFSTMATERDSDINVVSDSEGLIAFSPDDDVGGTVYEDEDGSLAIDFTSDEGASGVNVDARYQVGTLHSTQADDFERPDAWIDTHSATMSAHGYAFSIENQSEAVRDLTLSYDADQDEIDGYVGLAVEQGWGPRRELEIYDSQTQDSIEFPDVDPGNSVYVSLVVDSRGVENPEEETLSGELTVSAE